MSKIKEPYCCDECQSSKKPSNGWFIAYVEYGGTEDVTIIIKKWSDTIITERESNNWPTSHLCGIDCVSRWQVKELAKIYGNQVKP